MFQEPLFKPKADWTPPTVLPILDSVIALDVETRDPHLRESGPSFKRDEGEVIGIALADKNHQIYLPIAHQSGDNLNRETVIEYTRQIVSNASEIIMANALYDLGWLETLGIFPTCPIRDIQVAEALLDEERHSYSLNALSKDYLNRRKDETTLRAAADSYELANKEFDPKRDMWRLPARYVGRYGEIDARNTFDIYTLQVPRLRSENLWNVWELECEVTVCLRYMTRMGVPVDHEAAEHLRDELVAEEAILRKELGSLDIWSPPQLGEYLTKKGVKVPKTEKGNYSCTKEFLAHAKEPICQRINELRGINRLRKVFVEDIALKGTYRGRIHADFRQTASEDGGTRSGRLSSSNPNLQQVPKRSKWGKRIRSLYIAEPDTLWCKADYSSQEPRLQVHYALLENLPGAVEAKEAFERGVKLYTFFEEATGLPYDTCKMLCLGIGYGMGKIKMSETLGVSVDECESILTKFNRKAPFLRQLFDRTMAAASSRGYIRTIYGRKAHFNQWTPGFGHPVFRDRDGALAYNANPQQNNTHSKIERAFTSKALNRLIQGGCADMSKLAMVRCFREGLDVRLPVHDEICAMVKNKAEGEKLGQIMKDTGNLLKVKVPMEVDLDVGPTWC